MAKLNYQFEEHRPDLGEKGAQEEKWTRKLAPTNLLARPSTPD